MTISIGQMEPEGDFTTAFPGNSVCVKVKHGKYDATIIEEVCWIILHVLYSEEIVTLFYKNWRFYRWMLPKTEKLVIDITVAQFTDGVPYFKRF